jgi:hypothetical protein
VDPTDEIGLVKVHKIEFGLHHLIGLIELIKIHMGNVQIGVWMREIGLIQDLHAESTGLTGAPWFRIKSDS